MLLSSIQVRNLWKAKINTIVIISVVIFTNFFAKIRKKTIWRTKKLILR